MKLVDKIQQAYSGKLSDYSTIYTPTAEVIEKIADDYAIEFSEWKDENCFNQGDGFYNRKHKDEAFTLKELLEMYKEEKGL